MQGGTGFIFSYVVENPAGSDINDVAAVPLTWNSDKKTFDIGATKMLTKTAAISESQVHMARFGSGYLAGWTRSPTANSVRLVKLDANLIVASQPRRIAVPPFYKDDWFNYQNGDVGWVGAWGSPRQLRLVRVAPCN